MNQHTILVVDDTASILKLTRNIFEIAGYEVITAVDGDLALDILDKEKIDLVVTDILMPNTDGYLLCYTIRITERLKDIPVIIYSATYTSSSDEEMAMEIGADKFIRKPAPMDDLIAAARYLLSDARSYSHKVPEKPKSLEATRLYNEGLVNKLERRNLELEEAKVSLETSELRLREAQTIAHIGSWEIDMVTQAQHWSDELFNIYGIGKEEALPSIELFLSFIHPEDLDFARQNIGAAFETLTDSSFDFRFIRPDGALRYGFSKYRFDFDNDHKPMRLNGIVQDVTEKKMAEEALLKSEANLRTIFENSDTGFVLLNARLEVLSFNELASEWILDEGHMHLKEGEDFLSFNPPHRKELVSKMMREVLSGGYIEYEVNVPESNPLKSYYVRLRSIKNKDGKVLGVCINVSNVTERKKTEVARRTAEQELKDAHEKLLFHIENTPLGFIEWDNGLNVKSWSRRAEEIFGWSEGEFKSSKKDGYSQVYEEDLPWVSKVAEQLVTGEVSRNRILHRNYTRDGRIIWCEWFNSAMKDKDGKVITVMSLVQDVTERKLADEALTRAHERLLFHIENTTLGFIEWDNHHRVKSWSKTAEAIFGWNEKELIDSHKTALSMVYDEDLPWISEMASRLVSGESESSRLEHRNYTEDGRVIWCEWFNSVLKDKDGKVNTIMSLVQNITEQKMMEVVQREKLEKLVEERTRELNEALTKEKELVELKSKFVSIASHEFRTPLSTISFAAESIRNYYHQLSAEEIQRKLIKIEDQTSHMTNLLDDILTIGKAEAGKIKVKRISLDLKEFIESLIEEVRSIVKEQRIIQFTFSCANSKVNADDKLLRNVITNLLTNALKFSAADTPVVIVVSDLIGSILIEVTDQGIGIDENEFTAVFESFQRGSNVSNIQGTGLGLAILKKAVELMDGSIEVKSSLNKGSSFSVEIPIL
jgi:PAS domain S-box-containing protein